MVPVTFSIIIPVYGTESLLPRAIDSVLGQTYRAIELIIVNDGSPGDECNSIVQGIVSDIPVRYIRKAANEGLFLARKTGIAAAKNDYIIHLDSDDSLSLEACEILTESLEVADVDYIEFAYRWIASDEKRIMLPEIDTRSLVSLLANKCSHTIWNKCYSRAFLAEVYSGMPDFYAVMLEDYYQSAIIEHLAKRRSSIRRSLYDYHVGIGVTGAGATRTLDGLARVATSRDNVFSNITEYFSRIGREDAVACAGIYREAQIIEALDMATDFESFRVVTGGLDAAYIQYLVFRKTHDRNSEATGRLDSLERTYRPFVSSFDLLALIIRNIKRIFRKKS